MECGCRRGPNGFAATVNLTDLGAIKLKSTLQIILAESLWRYVGRNNARKFSLVCDDRSSEFEMLKMLKDLYGCRKNWVTICGLNQKQNELGWAVSYGSISRYYWEWWEWECSTLTHPSQHFPRLQRLPASLQSISSSRLEIFWEEEHPQMGSRWLEKSWRMDHYSNVCL